MLCGHLLALSVNVIEKRALMYINDACVAVLQCQVHSGTVNAMVFSGGFRGANLAYIPTP